MKAKDYLLGLYALAEKSGDDEVCKTFVIAASLVNPDKDLNYSQQELIADMVDEAVEYNDENAVASSIAHLINEA